MDVFQALAESFVSVALRRSLVLYPLVNAAHILGIGLLIGAIFTLDLRILGFFRHAPMAALAPPLVRVAGAGTVLALASGLLLFCLRPAAYAANPAFLAKLALVAGGLLNIMLLRLGSGWERALAGAPMGAAVRMAAAASLLLWLGAVLAGRWIAFLE